MTFPSIIFGIVLSTACGTAFHFFKGGALPRLWLYILMAWIGFWAGHFLLGDLAKWTFLSVGPLHVGSGILAVLVVLIVGDWLSRIEVTRKG